MPVSKDVILPKGATLIDDKKSEEIVLPKGAKLVTTTPEQPVKKKENPVISATGGAGFVSGTKPIAQSPSPSTSVKEETEEDDPVKAILTPIKSRIDLSVYNFDPTPDATSTVKPLNYRIENEGKISEITKSKEQTGKAIQEYNQARTFLKNSLSIPKAKEYLKSFKPDNDTYKLSQEKVQEYNDVVKDVEAAPSLELYAIDKYRKQNPQFNALVTKLESQHPNEDRTLLDYKKLLGDATVGNIVASQVLSDPNIDEYIKSGQPNKYGGSKNLYEDEYNNLKENILTEYPSFGVNVVANKVSRERQKRGLNSKLANFDTNKNEELNNKIASEILTPKEKQIYDGTIKDNQKEYIDVPGFVNAVSEGIQSGLSGMKETFSNTSTEENIKNELSKQFENVSAGEKGWDKSIREMGHMTGFVMQMAAGGVAIKGVGIPAELADKTMVISDFLGNSLNEGHIKYPNDNLKATVSGLSNTTAFAVLSDILPAGKVNEAIGGIKKEFSKALSDLSSENISQAAIKDAIATAFSKGLEMTGAITKQHGKSVMEMLALTKFNQGIDKALGLDQESYDFYHPAGEDEDVVKSMAIANIIPSAVAGYGAYARRNYTKDAIWDAANNPKRFQSVIDGQQLPADIAQSLSEKIQLLSNTKNVLDEKNIPENQQKTYLLHAANEKELEKQILAVSSKAAEIKDPVLRGKEEDKLQAIKNNIQQSQAIKEKILKGEPLKNPDSIPQDFKEKENEDSLSPDDLLFKSAYDIAGEGITRTLAAAEASGDKKSGVDFLREQALSNTKPLRDQLGKDKKAATELTVDLIASNEKEDIVQAIMKHQTDLEKEMAKDEPNDDRVSSLDKSISLLEKGLDKKIKSAEPKERPSIESAVIEINGKTFEGKNHAEAILKAKQAGEDISKVDRQGQGKFKLSDGTVIDRAEAKQRFGQDRAELLIPQDEAADNANNEYGDGSTPKNESVLKKGADEIYNNNSEISKIGTEQEYSDYLNSVFPGSKFKDVVYHGSRDQYENFNDNTFFALGREYAEGYSKVQSMKEFKSGVDKKPVVYPAIVNVKDVTNKNDVTAWDLPKEFDTVIGNDALGKEQVLVIRKGDQAHILGSKKDIEGFKKWKESQSKNESVSVPEERSDADIEKRMMEIQDSNPRFDSAEQKQFNDLEKEMEKRERNSVFSKPLSEVVGAVDELVKKEKEQPNGYGSFIEKRDARQTKEVAEKYLDAKSITDAELKQDFRDAVMGNPDTWYADGLKLRESMKEATNRGIDIKDMVAVIEKEFIKDGYSAEDAKETVARKLAPIYKDSQPVNENKIPQKTTVDETKPSGPAVVLPADNKAPDVVPLVKEGDVAQPPTEPPPAKVEPVEPEKQWTAIRKEKQVEIDQVKEAYEKQGVQTWSNTLNQGLERVQLENPGSTLYDASKLLMNKFFSSLQNKVRLGGDEKDLAVMQNLKRETSARIADLSKDLNSSDDIKREVALMQAKNLYDDLVKTALVIKDLTSTGGKVLNYAQSELAFDPEYGLQIRRMQLQDSNNGEPLSEAQLEKTAELWREEKEILQKENELRAQGMQEEFDHRLADLEKKYKQNQKSDQPIKAPEAAKKKTLSQSGKDAADRLRKGKLGKDQTLSTFPGVKQAVNLVIEAIAQIVEKGATVAEAITQFVKDNVEKGKEKEFKDAFLDHIYSANKTEDAAGSIKEFAETNKLTDISVDMVAKNHIHDFVDSYLGNLEPKDILGQATKDLKEILPDVTKEKVLEAYLKNGDYEIPTKEKLEKDFAADKRELNNLAKLEQDILDLQSVQELRKRSFPTSKERTEAEKELINNKNEIINSIKAEKNKLTYEAKSLEKERQAQIKSATKDSESERKKIEREQKIKADKISKLDEDINSVNSQWELMKRSVSKSDRKIDEDILAKQKDLRQALVDKGEKLAREDKYTKSSFVTRAATHNDRLKNISDKISERLNDQNISPEEKQSLEKLKESIDTSTIFIDDKSALSQATVLDHGLTRLKEVADAFNKTKGNEEFKRLIQRSIDKFDRDKESSEQDMKLQRVKERMKNDNLERERKINAGEFEEKQPVILKKSDSELIKLKIQRDRVESLFNYEKRKLEDKKRSFGRRVIDFVKAAYVTSLIYKFGTMAKVAATSLLRPNVEAFTKGTFGNIFKLISPDIAERAKAGGEGASLKSIQKMYEAYFMQRGEKGLEKIYADANAKYEKAKEQYTSYKDSDNKDPNKEKELKNKMDTALVDATGNMIFQYIGGSSLKDAFDALLHRSNKIEREFGFLDSETFKDGNVADKAKYVLEFIGRSHSAIKTFSGRANFAAGFIARLEAAQKEGVDISNPDKILEIANESYLDWDRGKYQQKNFISDSFNAIPIAIEQKFKGTENEKYAKAFSAFIKFDVAITRVPVNLLHEAVMEYALGAFRALGTTAKTYHEARKEAKAEGYTPNTPEFKAVIKDYISNLDKDQAATIVRSFRKGGFGLGLFALFAISGLLKYGGFHHRGEKKETDDEDELLPGEIEIAGVRLPKLVAKIAEHTPGLFPTLMGANMAKVYSDKVADDERSFSAAMDAMMAQLQTIQDQIPQSQSNFYNPITVSKDAYRSVKRQLGITTKQ